MTYISEKRLIHIIRSFKTSLLIEKRSCAQGKNANKIKLLIWKGSLLFTPDLQALRPPPPRELPSNICLLPEMKQLHILYIFCIYFISSPFYISRRMLFILLYTLICCLFCYLFIFFYLIIQLGYYSKPSNKDFSHLFSRLYWFPMNKDIIII